MELDRSIASTMLMPWLVTFSARAPDRGRANATIAAASRRLRSMKSNSVMARPARGPRSSTGTRENTMAGGRWRRRHIHQMGRPRSSTNAQGETN